MAFFYQNYYNEEITEAQAIKAGSFSKVFVENGVVKVKEVYEDNLLQFYDYYKSPDETDIEIINIYSVNDTPFNIIERTVLSNYIIETVKFYKGIIYQAKSRYLFDLNGYTICTETYDLVTDKPVYSKTKKYKYDLLFDDYFPIIEASYKNDRSLDIIVWNSYGADQEEHWFYENGIHGESDLPTLAGLLGINMSEITYYLNAILEP